MRKQPPLKRQLVLLQILRGRDTPCHTGPHRKKALGLVRKQRDGGGECGQKPLKWFPQEETSEAECARLGLASLNNFRALGHRGCPWLSATWLWGDQGWWTVALSVRA